MTSMILRICVFNFLLILLHFTACAQFNIGAHYSTFNIPANRFKTQGAGLSAEFGRNINYSVSLSYFSKKMPVDSFSYLPPPPATIGYSKYQNQYNFLQLSSDFLKYLVGSEDWDDKFSFYVGAGIALVYKMEQTKFFNTNETASDHRLKPGFEFLTGIDYKLGSVKIYTKGKASMFLTPILQVSDATTLNLLSNTEFGIMLPLNHPK